MRSPGDPSPASPAAPPDGPGRYLALACFLGLIFYLNFLSRVILAPLLPLVKTDLRLDNAQAGSLFLMISLGYLIGLLASGFISSKLSHRRTIVLSALAGAATLGVIPFCQGTLGLRLGLVGLGLACGLYLPSGVSTLTDQTPPQAWGKALAIHELAPSLALLTSPLWAELFLGLGGWQEVLWPVAAACALVGLLFGRYKSGPPKTGTPLSLASLKAIFKLKSYYIMMCVFGLAVGTNVGLYSMLPLFLTVERGLDPSLANRLLALSRLSTLIMSFVAGWATDKFGPRRTLTGVLVAVGLSTILLGLAQGDLLPLALFIQPFFPVCIFPAAFSILATVVPPHLRGTMVSLTIPAGMMLGIGVVPTVIGYLGDRGSFATGIVALGCLTFLGVGLVRRLQITPAR